MRRLTATANTVIANQLGATNVVATATDASGNQHTCNFSIVVQDTTPPVLTCPASPVVVEATSAEGALVAGWPIIAADAVIPRGACESFLWDVRQRRHHNSDG